MTKQPYSIRAGTSKGRDKIGGNTMRRGQQLEFEVIKRQYAHLLDVITYDDLLRRLDHTIDAVGP